MSNIELSKHQKNIVLHMDSPLIVASGAGSGKTKTLISKIEYIVNELEYDPRRILAITFTNKAANEIKNRLKDATGKTVKDFPWVRTFHSACLNILKYYIESFGYKPPIIVYSDSQQRKVLTNVIIENGLEKTELNFIHSVISRAKNSGEPLTYLKNIKSKLSTENLIRCYDDYNDVLKKNNVIDFDDILLLTRDLLRDNKDIRDVYKRKFQYVMVDEFQDTNDLQMQIFFYLVRDNNYMVIGDDYQCWAGDNVVDTINGSKFVKDLCVGDKAQCVFRSQIEYKQITNISKSQDMILEITTRNGNILKVNKKHKCFANVPSIIDDMQSYRNENINIILTFNHNNLIKKDYHISVYLENKQECKYFNNYIKAIEYALYLKNKYNANIIYEQFKMPQYSKCGNAEYLNVLHASQLTKGMCVPIIVDNKIVLDEIISIKETIIDDVYDIEVAESGNLIANDIVSHNSIYAFRGANPLNFINFCDYDKNIKMFKLEENYRCPKEIVDAAGVMIAKNEFKMDKTCFSNKEGGRIYLLPRINEEDEAYSIADLIKKYIRNGIKPHNIAILYRTKFCSRVIEQSMRRNFIPYQMLGGVGFYERREIMDLTAYLLVAINTKDSQSFERILSSPKKGVGPKLIEKILKDSPVNTSLYESFRIAVHGGKIGSKQKQEILYLFDIIEKIKTMSPANAIEYIIKKTNYEEYMAKYSSDSSNYETRKENIKEMIFNMGKYNSIEEYIADAALMFEEQDSDEGEDTGVILSTIHGSKGLEYDIVFLVGMEEGLFPHSRCLYESKYGIEEERRLMYVAMTRSIKELILSYAANRQGKKTIPSQFLKDIPRKYLVNI